MKSQDPEQQAKNYSFRILAQRSYFSHRLKEKLLQRGYGEEVACKVIAYLIHEGFLKDEELLISHVEHEKRKKKSPKAVIAKLRSRGIAQAEIDSVRMLLPSHEEQKIAVLEFLKKHLKSASPPEKQKIARALLRRGFDFDLIFESLREFSSTRYTE